MPPTAPLPTLRQRDALTAHRAWALAAVCAMTPVEMEHADRRHRVPAATLIHDLRRFARRPSLDGSLERFAALDVLENLGLDPGAVREVAAALEARRLPGEPVASVPVLAGTLVEAGFDADLVTRATEAGLGPVRLASWVHDVDLGGAVGLQACLAAGVTLDDLDAALAA